MGLLKREDKELLPELYAVQADPDPTVFVKLFYPAGAATWFLIEYSEEDNLAFGYVYITEWEFGYISLDELEGLAIGGLKVERDEFWTPKPVSAAKEEFLKNMGL